MDTTTKIIISFVVFCIATCAWGFVTMSSASDMDCFRLESARAWHKQSKGIEKVKAYKAVKSLTLLCNKSI